MARPGAGTQRLQGRRPSLVDTLGPGARGLAINTSPTGPDPERNSNSTQWKNKTRNRSLERVTSEATHF